MGGAASLIPGGAASLIPEQIDIDSFRTLSGDKFIQEVFDSFKDEKGFISQSLLLDLNSVNSRLPRFKEAIAIYQKHNMQPITEAELPNLLKEVGLLPTVEGLLPTQEGKLSFAEFFKIVKERLSKIDTAVLDAFEMFDINRDGHVSKQEIKTVMAQLGEAINNEKVDSIVRAADIDSDGIISIEEFQKSVYPALSTMVRSAAAEISKKKREENASLESFKIFDVDGDGFVTAEEIKAVLNKLGRGATDEAVAAMIKAADVDGDGRISLNEFL